MKSVCMKSNTIRNILKWFYMNLWILSKLQKIFLSYNCTFYYYSRKAIYDILVILVYNIGFIGYTLSEMNTILVKYWIYIGNIRYALALFQGYLLYIYEISQMAKYLRHISEILAKCKHTIFLAIFHANIAKFNIVHDIVKTNNIVRILFC